MKSDNSVLPKLLVDGIRNGKVVLFLGAGASWGAQDDKKQNIPLGNVLSNKLAEAFLDNTYMDQPLGLVSEVAISEAGLLKTQSFVKKIFQTFQPAQHHLLIPEFKWQSIFTTNYDYIIEEAYRTSKSALQELEPVYRNTITEEIFKNDRSLPYYKLHGCLDCINDDKLPLILSPDQYATHRTNRENLYRQLEGLAYDHIFLFVGFSFGDTDIRQAINLASGKDNNRPRWYMVGPNIREAEKSLYESKSISSIKMTFADFLNELNIAIPKDLRKIYFSFNSVENHPFFSQFATDISNFSDTVKNFIDNSVEYISKSLTSEPVDPASFYKGYFYNWDPILKNLDTKRSIEDNIISEAYLNELTGSTHMPEFYVILGHAGAGKSVLLKRLAYNAGITYDCMSFYLKAGATLKYEPIYELYKLVNCRFFIHVDNLSENSDHIFDILNRGRKDQIPVTIITTERHNIWNVEYDELKQLVDATFNLGNLNRNEITEILHLLDRHNSLGHLAKLTFEQRIHSLENISNRQLLVALHEVTSGKPFSEIIQDEYNSILDVDAKRLYLSVCILHRLGCFTRAGLISRVHNIRFEEFQKKLFKPLEHIVYAKENNKVRDYIFETRHQQVAELVFETILTNEQDRYDEYYRIISNLNIDFESDRTAYILMTKARNLINLFPDPLKVKRLYKIAEKTNPNDPNLLQQQAIYELKRPNPNRTLAEQYINEALRLSSNSPSLNHTKAELILDKAINSNIRLVKQKLLQECEQICSKLISKEKNYVHAYHTILKAKIHRLEYFTNHEMDSVLDGMIKDVEKHLILCKQLFPEEQFILNEESTFNGLIDNKPKALESLLKAFKANPSSPYVSIRLSKLYLKNKDVPSAISTCQETLALNPYDKDVNFQYGLLKQMEQNPDYVEIRYAFKKAFTSKDTRYEAQFWYGRACFILKDFDKYKEIYQVLSKARIDHRTKIAARGIIKNGKNNVNFKGKIVKLEYSFGIIRRDELGDTIYFSKLTEDKNWSDFRLYNNVNFNVGFNFKGAIAINIFQID